MDESDPKPGRRVTFQYPALPWYESLYYLLFGCGLYAYAWTKVYQASRSYEWDGWWGIYEINNVTFFGELRKDATNYEWARWVPFIKQMLPWLCGHSLLFNLSERILPSNIWKLTVLIYWLFASFMLFGFQLLYTTILSGMWIYLTMRLTRSRLAVWAIGILILYLTLNYTHTINSHLSSYIAISFLSYKMLQYISFTLEECTNSRMENARFFDGLYNMLWFAFYFPYMISLIFIYKHFPAELSNRPVRKREWRRISLFGARMLFWFAFIQFFLHFMYFDALMLDRDFLMSTSEDTLLSIAYATGQFFQMKYVVMFGVPAFFARLDNMAPLKGPICIARVSLYSKIWRNFDRGLYQFFKEYLFLPICRPTFSLPRVIFGVFISYGFVLVWHGFTHQYIVWIILNISELFLEQTVKRLYSINAVRKWRETTISDLWFRRFLAICQLVPLAFGLYAIFYFLSDSDCAYVVVDRIFWQETYPWPKWPVWLLFFIGYHFNQMCMDVEVWQDEKLKAKDKAS